MTGELIDGYGRVTVIDGGRGSRLVKIGEVAVKVSEMRFAIYWMARIQGEDFPDDDNACLNVLGDLYDIDVTDPPTANKRACRQIDKKWDAVRLVKRQSVQPPLLRVTDKPSA